MTDITDQVRGVFLAALMVLSVIGGSVAFTGGAAAAPGHPVTVINPDGSTQGSYSTIQAAIDNSSTEAGDTIEVDAAGGPYNEEVIVDKGVALESVNGTATIRLDATDGAPTVKVTADGASVSGFEIVRDGSTGGDLVAQSLQVEDASNVVIENNILTTANRGDWIAPNELGGLLVQSDTEPIDDVTVTGNTINESGAGLAIDSRDSVGSLTITDNTVKNSRDNNISIVNQGGGLPASINGEATESGQLNILLGSNNADNTRLIDDSLTVVRVNKYYVDVTQPTEPIHGSTVQIQGEIYDGRGNLVDGKELFYGLAFNDSVESGTNSSTNDGKFVITTTIDRISGANDQDYPADDGSGEFYEVLVGDQPVNQASNGSSVLPVRLDLTLDSPSPGYNQSVTVNGSLDDASGAVGDYPIAVQSPSGNLARTQTAQNGAFGYTVLFNDAAVWEIGTDRDGFVTYETVTVGAKEISVDFSAGESARFDFNSTFTVEVTDDDSPVDTTTSEYEGYVKVTGNFTSVDQTDVRKAVDVDQDSVIEEVWLETNSSGTASFDAVPTNEDNPTASLSNGGLSDYGGLENTNDAGDTPTFPDFTGSDTAGIDRAEQINIISLDVKDEGSDGGPFTSIDFDGDDEFTADNESIDVLPFAFNNSQSVINGARVGNDTNFGTEDLREYRITFDARNISNVPYELNGPQGANISEITVTGAGVNLTITETGDEGYNFDSGTHELTFQPTEQSSPSDEITVSFKTESNDPYTRTFPTEGLNIDRFEVDGEEQSSVTVGQTVNLSAIVTEADGDGTPVNNGKVRLAQNRSGALTEIASFDGRTDNTNDGVYTFGNVTVDQRAVDDDGDNIAEPDQTIPLVFTAYDYVDADENQALEQNEVATAVVRTLEIVPKQNLQIEFLSEEEHEYLEESSGNLTAGVGYENITIRVTNADGPVDLTQSPEGSVTLKNVSDELISVNNESVQLDQTATNASAGVYVIEEINGSVDADSSDDNILFGDSAVDTTFDIDVQTPGLENSDPSGVGEFEVVRPEVETEVVAVERPDGSTDELENRTVETLTATIDRTYTIRATVTDAAGEPINGDVNDTDDFGEAAVVVSSDADFDFNQSSFRPDVNGTFEYTVTPNETGSVDYNVSENDPGNNDPGVAAVLEDAGPEAALPNINVLSRAGGVIPNQEFGPENKVLADRADDGSILSRTNGIVLPVDVQNQVRVEVFPADTEDVALPEVTVGIPDSDPVAESAVFTTTTLVNGTELASNYTQGQLGRFTFTPTGTGTDIIKVRLTFTGGSDAVTEPTGASRVVENIDVRESTSQLQIDIEGDSVTEDDVVNGTVLDANGDEVSDARVFVTAPDGSTETVFAEDGSFNFTADQPGTYQLEAVRVGFEPSNLAAVTVDTPADFQVSDLSAPANVTAGDNVTVTATITNDGGAEATQSVEFRVGGSTLLTQNVTLAGGASTTVTFEADTSALAPAGTTPPNLPAEATYTHGVFTGDDNATATLTVETAASAAVSDQSAVGNATEVVVDSYDLGVNGETVSVWLIENGTPTELLGAVTPNSTSGQDLVIQLDEPLSSNATIRIGIHDGAADRTDNLLAASDPAQITVQEPASFQVSDLSAPANATVGDTIEVSAVVANTGGVEATQTVEFRFDGQTLLTENVTLAGGANTTVTFEADTSGLSAGTFTHGVFTADDSATAEITLNEAGPPALPGFDNAPTDPDGDGTFEDIDGDGDVDVVDVQALFANLNSDEVQNNTDAFDIDGDGDIDIVDVQALFVASQEQE